MAAESNGQRVVVITGAGSNLGRDYAELFAADGFGVCAADIDEGAAEATAEGIRSKGGAALGAFVDVREEKSAAALVEAVLARFGRLDILVNNAGLYAGARFDPVSEVDLDHWDEIMAVNLRGPLVVARAVLPAMRQSGWGRIVNISSIGAYTLGGAYSASKLALHHLTWSLASEVGGDGITVNCIGPGTMDTESGRRHHGAEGSLARAERNIVKRLGTAKDIYAALRYFVSEDAEWCTGQVLMVNGGYNVRL